MTPYVEYPNSALSRLAMAFVEYPKGRKTLYWRQAVEGTKKFIYRWYHVPTGKSGTGILWCFDANAAFRLIENWNGETWNYAMT